MQGVRRRKEADLTPPRFFALKIRRKNRDEIRETYQRDVGSSRFQSVRTDRRACFAERNSQPVRETVRYKNGCSAKYLFFDLIGGPGRTYHDAIDNADKFSIPARVSIET
jgi:hypothetical protein